MFTVCPQCSLKLVVTAADLRVAQGYVRCGRCSNVFNALVGLSDEQQAVLAREERAAAGREQPAAAGPPAPAPKPPAQPPPDPSSVQIGLDRRTGEPISDASLEFDPVATDVSEVFIEPQLDEDGTTGQSETIILRSEDVELDVDAPQESAAHDGQPVDPGRAAQAARVAQEGRDAQNPEAAQDAAEPSATDEFELADLESLLDSGAVFRPAAASVAAAPTPNAADLQTPPESAGSDEPIPDDFSVVAPQTARTSRRVGLALQFGSGALALLLAVQIVDHYRATLADIDWLRPPLTALYARLGVPLVPHWDVGAYEVRQLGAIAGPQNPGALTVRASIKNTSARRQPLPLLRVTVQDRFGNRVAARDVPPRAYLPKASAGSGYLSAGQRVDAEIALVDPGPNVVGFEIDACLADAAGHVACASDASGAR